METRTTPLLGPLLVAVQAVAGCQAAPVEPSSLPRDTGVASGDAGAGVLVASDGLVTARRGVVTANSVGLAIPAPGAAELDHAVYSFGNTIDASADGVEPKPPDVDALIRPLGAPGSP